ncbi:hypothetical protein ANN_23514 [Periplaneta americana]|uniref:Late endosomal/lysosomal adaptor and MAPK and MTOR activator 5 n=1 Tax=Periplaneta americana TaxID=6978 RepID=A0ABQ8SML9_PERAM|nr:hypothetical protein ANN_23514 [Periplaneta americana]
MAGLCKGGNEPARDRRKKTFRRPRRIWEDNIRMDLREVGSDDRDWIDLARIGTDGGLIDVKKQKTCEAELPIPPDRSATRSTQYAKRNNDLTAIITDIKLNSLITKGGGDVTMQNGGNLIAYISPAHWGLTARDGAVHGALSSESESRDMVDAVIAQSASCIERSEFIKYH